MPRLLVDASAAFDQGAGIGRYARGVLTAAMAEMPEWWFTLWGATEHRHGGPFRDSFLSGLPSHARFTVRHAPFSRKRADQVWFRARIPLPWQLLAGRGDLAYSPDFTVPPALGIPEIATLHDLAFLITPDFTPKALRSYLERAVPRQAERAVAIATVSEATKRDLIERLRVKPSSIRVIPNGVDRRYIDAMPLAAEARSRLGLPDTYLLTVGTIEPRKNHLGLLDALAWLEGAVDLPLVVVGRTGWASDEIISTLRRASERGRVIMLNYLDEAELPGVYASASALVYPSWYEGFGLPVLEALAAGIPIAASDVPAHREVAGNLGAYGAPSSPESLAAAITTALQAGDRYSPAGAARRERASKMTWDHAGLALRSMLNEFGS